MGYECESLENFKARMDSRVREIDAMIESLKAQRDSIILQSYPKSWVETAPKEIMDFLGFVETDLLPTNVRKDRAARLRRQYGGQ